MVKRYLAFGVLLAGCTGQVADPRPGAPGLDAQGATTGMPGASVGGSSSTSGSNGTVTGSGGGVTTDTSSTTGSSGAVVALPEPTAVPRIARLTHFQWTNSVQDLLRLDEPPSLADDFTPDAIIGFDTNSAQLRMSNTLREDYERAAETLASQVVNDPDALARLLPTDAPDDPRAFIESFGLRAYRRPLTTEEMNQHLTLFEQAPELVPELDAFSAGVMLSIRLFLQSPYFLYRTELGQENVNGRVPLSGYEVAAKLALGVTGSIPDDTLLAVAAAGSLDPGNNQATVDSEAQRLLGTPRSQATSLHAHTQALALSRYALIQKDPTLYPEFTTTTADSMRTSAELFLVAIYDGDQGIRSLLTSTEAFVDANLAPIYGVSGTFGSDFQRVDLTGLPRKGFLTQAGFLSLFAGEHQPDPIHRGVFINQQVLCIDIGPPSTAIPSLPEDQSTQTNRQVIEALTGWGTCGQSCHATVINPLGYAFEHYDPLGRYRTTDNGVAVDAADVVSLDGAEVAFADALELVDLLANSNAAHHCYARNLLSYLNGRLADSSDAAVLDEVARRSNTEDLSTKDVIRSLVESESFLTRLAEEEP